MNLLNSFDEMNKLQLNLHETDLKIISILEPSFDMALFVDSWEIVRNQLTISCQIVANISKLQFYLIYSAVTKKIIPIVRENS